MCGARTVNWSMKSCIIIYLDSKIKNKKIKTMVVQYLFAPFSTKVITDYAWAVITYISHIS